MFGLVAITTRCYNYKGIKLGNNMGHVPKDIIVKISRVEYIIYMYMYSITSDVLEHKWQASLKLHYY